MSKSKGDLNKVFLSIVDSNVRQDILQNIANHYGVDVATIYEEVTDSEAEHLIEYVTVDRAAVHLVMKQLGFGCC